MSTHQLSTDISNSALRALRRDALPSPPSVRGRPGPPGALLGFGAAAKFFPAQLLVPFAAERFRAKEPRRAAAMLWWALWAWLLADLPFIVLKFHNWETFFTFNKHRPAGFDSLWFIACDHLHGKACLSTQWLDNWSIA